MIEEMRPNLLFEGRNGFKSLIEKAAAPPPSNLPIRARCRGNWTNKD